MKVATEKNATRMAFLLLALPLLTGCAAIPMALDGVIGGISVYQRYEDRQAQKDQTEAIRAQTDEIIKLREAIERRPLR